MISRIEQIKALLRKANLKNIVRAGKIAEDDDNSYNEPKAPSMESSDSEGLENLEQMFGDKKKKRSPDVRYNLKNKEQKDALKEKLLNDQGDRQSKQQRLEEMKQLRETAVPYDMDMAIAKYRKLQKELALPFNPGSPMFKQNIKIEMQALLEQFPELAESVKSLDESDKEFDLANPEFSDTDEEPQSAAPEETEEVLTEEEKREKQLFSKYQELAEKINKSKSEDDKQKLQESLSSILSSSPKIARHYELVKELAKYGKEMSNLELESSKIDIAMRNAIASGQDVSSLQDQLDEVDAKTEKLQSVREPLQKELMELIKTIEGKRGNVYKNDNESDRFSLDDVLIMANDAFTIDDAKKQSGDASPEDLKSSIKQKMQELGMYGEKEEQLEEVESYFFGKTTTAEESEEVNKKRGRKSTTFEDIKDLAFHDVPEDWMKKLTVDQKLEMADYVELFAWNKYLDKLLKQKEKEAPVDKGEETARALETLEQNFGTKEKPQHSGIKRINPETGEVTYISLEQWEQMVAEKQKAKREQKAIELERMKQAASVKRFSIREADAEKHTKEYPSNFENDGQAPDGKRPGGFKNKEDSDRFLEIIKRRKQMREASDGYTEKDCRVCDKPLTNEEVKEYGGKCAKCSDRHSTL